MLVFRCESNEIPMPIAELSADDHPYIVVIEMYIHVDARRRGGCTKNKMVHATCARVDSRKRSILQVVRHSFAVHSNATKM